MVSLELLIMSLGGVLMGHGKLYFSILGVDNTNIAANLWRITIATIFGLWQFAVAYLCGILIPNQKIPVWFDVNGFVISALFGICLSALVFIVFKKYIFKTLIVCILAAIAVIFILRLPLQANTLGLLYYVQSIIGSFIFSSTIVISVISVYNKSIKKLTLIISLVTSAALTAFALLLLYFSNVNAEFVTLISIIFNACSAAFLFLLDIYSHRKAKAATATQEESSCYSENTEDEQEILFPELSQQENNLAVLILQGYTEGAICKAMNITINTEKSYRKSVYNKLDIHTKQELFELASRLSKS